MQEKNELRKLIVKVRKAGSTTSNKEIFRNLLKFLGVEATVEIEVCHMDKIRKFIEQESI